MRPLASKGESVCRSVFGSGRSYLASRRTRLVIGEVTRRIDIALNRNQELRHSPPTHFPKKIALKMHSNYLRTQK